MDEQAKQSGVFYRRSTTAMAMIAVFSYVFAFSQEERGTRYYQQYEQAYTECFTHVLEAGTKQTDCNFIPEVRVHLAAHREAFAVGEPFLNLALALTAGVLVLPLLRKLAAAFSRYSLAGPGAVQPKTPHDMMPPVFVTVRPRSSPSAKAGGPNARVVELVDTGDLKSPD